MYIIGISAFFHDSSIAVIDSKDGKILFALQEERLSRSKNDKNFPFLSLNKIKNKLNIQFNQIEAIVFYEKPFLKLSRILDTFFDNPFKTFSLYKNFLLSFNQKGHGFKSEINDYLNKIWPRNDFSQIIFFNYHHLSHSSGAYYNSSFNEAALVTIDGVGEWDTYVLSEGKGKLITKIECEKYPNSLGIFYSAFTVYCGFKANSGEYKFMGLAPFGEPIYIDLIKQHFVSFNKNGTFAINTKLINPSYSQEKILRNIEKVFNVKQNQNSNFIKFFADIACSVQKITEECIVNLLKRAQILLK